MSADSRCALALTLADEDALFDSYMPFVAGCGIFVAGEMAFSLGDSVSLQLTLPYNNGDFRVATKVVWLNAEKPLGKRVAGIGLQIVDSQADAIRETIERILGARVNSPLPTATM